MILAVGKEDEEQLKYSIGLNAGLARMLVLPISGWEAVIFMPCSLQSQWFFYGRYKLLNLREGRYCCLLRLIPPP